MSNVSGNGLSPVRHQAITWTNAVPVHSRIYAKLKGDELKLLMFMNIYGQRRQPTNEVLPEEVAALTK